MVTSTLLDNPWLESVVLVAASRRAGRLSPEARERMRPWVAAAQARFQVARELRDSRTQLVALGLLKEAAFFALCALECIEEAPERAPGSPKEAWQRFDALAETPQGAPERLALVRTAFSTEDP